MKQFTIPLREADEYGHVDCEIVKVLVPQARNPYQYLAMTGPEGGRLVTNGPVIAKQWAWVAPSAICICADPSQNTGAEYKRAKVETLGLGEQFEIVGLGVHHLEKFPHSDNLVLVRESDGFRAGY